jgi:hypothetical protein
MGLQSDAQRPFAGTRGKDKVAPTPAVRRTPIAQLKSTLKRGAAPLSRAEGMATVATPA